MFSADLLSVACESGLLTKTLQNFDGSSTVCPLAWLNFDLLVTAALSVPRSRERHILHCDCQGTDWRSNRCSSEIDLRLQC